MTYSTGLKTFCHRCRCISVSFKRHSPLWTQVSLEKQVPGTAHSRTGQSWRNIAGAAASAWFRSGWFQRLPYHGCLPCLTARGYHTCSRDVSNSRAARNWSFNYHSIQLNHSKLCSALLGREETHPHFCLLCNTDPGSEQSSRMRNLWKTLKSFLQQTFARGPHLGSDYRHAYFQVFGQGWWLEARLRTTSSRRVQHRARPLVGTATGRINLSPSICIQQSSGHGFVGSSSLIQAFVREVIAVKLSAFTSTKAHVKM